MDWWSRVRLHSSTLCGELRRCGHNQGEEQQRKKKQSCKLEAAELRRRSRTECESHQRYLSSASSREERAAVEKKTIHHLGKGRASQLKAGSTDFRSNWLRSTTR
ncbi:hypothetical protein Taro_012326 [Colocasia esculenta]|uniref:Uncharacterized protein n=1 Tax=Colocasia esculenta TaxID=4460 RepID=A0A843UFA9_COLES|nr:hypothetical protein [Colocasia esculenta]